MLSALHLSYYRIFYQSIFLAATVIMNVCEQKLYHTCTYLLMRKPAVLHLFWHIIYYLILCCETLVQDSY